ncbi:hypothetical protein AMATHDRAFT_41543 [Amanita thiersii Skay4041]|uniref:Uncharacterized protein n=1 Tax=Amanita thiersii Skay4041 TaxID=703135 RepID=A0A2A9NP76_9AGAR|nr:hypothetical protein AMATHDRAFT_41543 [Amanita thiersii Skay4041]
MDDLSTLVAFAPPPFIFIHNPIAPATTAATTRDILQRLSLEQDQNNVGWPPVHVRMGWVDGVACFAPRILYDSVINALSGWTIRWEEGCINWGDGSGRRWNESVDAFVRGLKAVERFIREERKGKKREEVSKKTVKENGKARGRGRGKRKEKDKVVESDVEVDEQVRFVIVVEHAERLKESMPELIVPLARLAEVTKLDLTILFISQVRWEDMKPPLGASPDPYFIDIPPLTKQQITSQLESSFDAISNATPTTPPSPYHPSLRQLYTHFVSVLCDVCYPFTYDSREIHYIASARWPGFVQPILDDHTLRLQRINRRKQNQSLFSDTDMDIDGPPDYSSGDETDDDDDTFRPPTEDTRMRLSRLFKPTLTSALEDLYPRLTNAAAWAKAHSAPPPLESSSLPLSRPPSRPASPTKPSHPSASSNPQTPRTTRVLRSSVPNTPRTPHTPHTPRTPRTPYKTFLANAPADDTSAIIANGLSATLPRMSKFILIASFLASTNPPKSDVRMFGRGADEKKRRRRRSVSKGKAGGSTNEGPTKVPQRLQGPTPFALDRMLAILGSLLEENDLDANSDGIDPTGLKFSAIPGEHTDMEVSRVGVYTEIIDLAHKRLLHRTSPMDKLDGPPMFKCGVMYEDVLALAKELDVPLNDLLWDPV